MASSSSATLRRALAGLLLAGSGPRLNFPICAAEETELAKTCETDKIFARSVADECGPSSRRGASLEWTGFIGELFEARNQIFFNGVAVARLQLVGLLQLATQQSTVALECPSAVAATSYALAEILAAEQWNQAHQLALVQFALAVLPAAAHTECTQWPMRGRDLSAAFLQLYDSMSQKRLHSLNAPTLMHAESRLAGKHVAVVTACAGVHSADARRTSEENRKLYSTRHGYDLHFFNDAATVIASQHPSSLNLTATNALAFWRAHALRSVMDRNLGHTWLLWVDCDVLLTHMESSVQTLLTAHKIPDTVSTLAWADNSGIRPEVMLLRSSSWSDQFLKNWAGSPGNLFHGPDGRHLDQRHAERRALQHAVLPHWGSWLRGVPWSDWESFRWPGEVLVDSSLVYAAADEPQLAGENSGQGLLFSTRRSWRPGDFAWHDPTCRFVSKRPHAEKKTLCELRRSKAQAST